MTILGIETSTSVCSVGLIDEEHVSVERSYVESHVHSEKLQTLVQDVLQEANTPLRRLDAVAISIGPGSFTGLRIGLSSAKGFCYAIERPLVAVPTFESIAHAAAGSFSRFRHFLVMTDARQSDFYVGRFVRVGDFVEPEMEVTVKSLKDCAREMNIDETTLVLTDSTQQIQASFGKNVNCETVRGFCRGDVVARIGLQKYQAKQFSDLASVEPMYLKDFVVKNEPVNTQVSSTQGA